MRRPSLMLMVSAWLGAWSIPAACADDGGLPPFLLQAPSLATSIYFPPSTTTAGTAVTGPASVGHTPNRPCSSANPCALVTPAANSEPTAR